VTVNSKTTTGTGNSKKLAKHAAAKAMLDLLDGIAAQNVGAPGQEDNSTSAIVQNDVKVPAEVGETFSKENDILF
jgi:Double-stranded RNA binding motif